MFGAIIGDIVGSRFEFDDHKSKEFALFGGDGITDVPCEFTDDSVMTVAVADALLERSANEDDQTFKKRLVEKMHYHGKKRMNAGFGPKFYDWLKNGLTEPYNSCGNGSAMRVAPAGWVADSLEETERIARLTAEVTHDHPEGIKGAQAVAAVIWMARTHKSREEIRNYVETRSYPEAFLKSVDEIRPGYEYDGTCQGTVPPAVMAFYEATDFEDAVRNAVSLGGDSDTLADITAAMAEAFFGIPDAIRKEAMRYPDEEMRDVVLRFAAKYQNPNGR